MKRLLAAVALVAATAFLAPAPAAAAAPADPVKALERQYVPGHGVEFVLRETSVGRRRTTSFTMSGELEFDRSGVVAADVSVRGLDDLLGKNFKKIRFLYADRRLYIRPVGTKEGLPEGKSWVRLPAGDSDGEIFDFDTIRPSALKTLISRATSVKDRTYRGALSGKHAEAVSGGSGRFSYLLTLYSTGLPKRSVFHWKSDNEILGPRDHYSEMRLTNWGMKVDIAPPSEDQVIDTDDLSPLILEELSEIPDGAISSLGR
ncbi:hypothetical protein HII36_39820 [Nonomuraea sp. NN258]|uniref:hypothetical protein n=1 Tax=Nonomuraea antri TaxID=2730852 RepID=UPI0015694F5E|nr:hypothetical protein [Nonomuraea antri]NRQ37936.1 hypothetical protein [Nonomuraea antri]